MIYCGFDIGGTKSEVCLIQTKSDGSFDLLLRERLKTDREKGYPHILKVIEELWQKALRHSMDGISGAGFGLPGSIDPQSWAMINGNTQALVGKNLRDDFRKILGATPFVFDNDANCFAYAEVFGGLGKKYESITATPLRKQIAVGIILGTGCGSGIVYEGRILAGARGGAGEFGHSFLKKDGRVCYCGRQGCAELFLSGKGIEEKYLKRFGKEKSSEAIFAIGSGSSVDADFIHEYKTDLAFFLSNICSALNPHYFVLGGGLSNQEFLYEGLEATIESFNFLKNCRTQVFKNTLGDSAGVIGAALKAAHLLG